jgi:hypothetical protein
MQSHKRLRVVPQYITQLNHDDLPTGAQHSSVSVPLAM